MKKCKNCREPFEPRLPMQSACGPQCALAMAVSKRGKEEKRALVLERKADKEKREKLKSKAQWAREAQTAVNRYVRLKAQANGEGCKVRALANGPRFWDAKRVGRMVPSYRKEIESVFGKDWEAGHEKVKAEHARLRKLGGL